MDGSLAHMCHQPPCCPGTVLLVTQRGKQPSPSASTGKPTRITGATVTPRPGGSRGVPPQGRDWLSRTLRELREKTGMSGSKAAQQAGLSQSRISRIEAGRFLPTEEEIT